jgi:crossover junction endodeoxyribonuclease RusA
MIIITLEGQPQSNQHIYGHTCRNGFPQMYMTKEGKALKESYQWQAKTQWKQKPIEKSVEIFVSLYFKNKGKHDIDNFGKIMLDSLTGIVWLDDSQIWKMTISKFIDHSFPRIEVDVSEAL